jgi:2-dehydro-3-deoxy-D-gluconate 5-dehydrogenase
VSEGVLERFSLRGRGALVTGAARGLGHAMALALAEAGADIAAVDAEPLDAVEAAVAERGVRCVTREVDLRALTPEVAAELIAWSRGGLEDVSVLVNNAGMIRRAPAAETSAEDWHEVIGLNLTAPFFLAQAFAKPLLRDGARGSIVNVVSMNSFQGGMEVPAYTASKHGLLGITRALANEWTGRGIRVNGIAPGWMATELTAALREDPARDQALLARMPIGHWGEPADLAGAVVYLASDASNYFSGTFLAVDGGWLAR